MPASVRSTPPSPTDSCAPDKERDLELQAASPADLAASEAAVDAKDGGKEYLTDVHEIPKNNMWLVFTGVSVPVLRGGGQAFGQSIGDPPVPGWG